MMVSVGTVSILQKYGIGRRKLDDDVFVKDRPPHRLGVYDETEEDQADSDTPTQSALQACNFTADSTVGRYSCSQCKKILPSPHLLDLHIQEKHDSFFAVMAMKKPSYSCYIEECEEKFMNAAERLKHCVKIHKMPKDFRFDCKPKQKSKYQKSQHLMETEQVSDTEPKFNFMNSRQKGFKSYTGKKFTKEQDSSASVDMDAIMIDLKKNLPQS